MRATHRRRLRELGEFVRLLVPMVLFLGIFRSAVADWNDVPTGSMKPTILEGDRIVVNKLAYDLHVPFTGHRLLERSTPERGDIIVFLSPADGRRLVKRVVGVAGDQLALRRNRVIVNGEPADYAPLDQRTLYHMADDDRRQHRFAQERIEGREHPIMTSSGRHSARATFGPVIVPAGHVFVLGDNRDNSHDSRWFGFVRRDLIEGRATSVALSVDPEHHYAPRWDRFLTALR